MEARDVARLLFMQGLKQSEIARIIKRSENTVSKWARDGEWKEKKISIDLMHDNAQARLFKLFDHQTRMLERQVEQWDEDDPDGIHFIGKGDIDALQKLYTTIKRDASEFIDTVTVLKEFMTFLETRDVKLAQAVLEYCNVFISAKSQVA